MINKTPPKKNIIKFLRTTRIRKTKKKRIRKRKTTQKRS